MLTQENLKKVLHYSEASGEFRWRVASGTRAKPGDKAGFLKGVGGYWTLHIDGKHHKRSRLAWLYVYGTWPTEIDHINLDKSDDRINNLREVTRAQNQQNRALHKNNKTGYKGVREIKKKWVASSYMAQIKGKYLGVYKTPEEAHLAYQKAAAQMYGTYARF